MMKLHCLRDSSHMHNLIGTQPLLKNLQTDSDMPRRGHMQMVLVVTGEVSQV